MKPSLTAAALAASLIALAMPASADYTTASLAGPSGGSYSFYGDGTDAGSNFVGAAFHVPAGGFHLVSVIANFDGNANIVPGSGNQSIFVAIVPLSSPTALPSVTPSNLASIALANAVFAAPTVAGDAVIPLNVVLSAGDYATVFGAGLFGSSVSGSEGLQDGNHTIGTPNVFNSLGGPFASFGFDTGIRITDVPEPASLAVFGLGLAGLVSARRRRAN